jgi:hypothetical protein
VTGGDGRLETREQYGEFGIDFLNNDKLYFGVSSLYDLLRRPFAIGPGVTLPVGGYAFTNFPRQLQHGAAAPDWRATSPSTMAVFYNGDKTSLSIARGPRPGEQSTSPPSRPTR